MAYAMANAYTSPRSSSDVDPSLPVISSKLVPSVPESSALLAVHLELIGVLLWHKGGFAVLFGRRHRD